MQYPWQPTASRELVSTRASLLKKIRAFFDAHGVLEVETPLLSSACSSDPHLKSLHTGVQGQAAYLNTSPEFHMKRLLAARPEPMYQICKAFRDDETGPNHNPEFTLLEWYRPGFDMERLMQDVEALLMAVFIDASAEDFHVSRMSYRQAFENHAGLDPHHATTRECAERASLLGIERPVGLDAESEAEKDAWLDWLLTQCVLPALDEQQFCFIYDYPQSQCALARLETDASGTLVAKRFELFYGEIELANGFYELLDADEQRQRFEHDNATRIANGQPAAELDENFLAALAHGLPECSGVALGLDRLLMTLCRRKNIDQVLAFPWRRA